MGDKSTGQIAGTVFAKRTRSSTLGNLALMALSAVAIVLFLALFFALVAGCLYFVGISLGWVESTFRKGNALTIASMIGTLAALTGWSIWRAVTSKDEMPEGVYVTEENGRSLWRAVETVCNAAGTRLPDKIVLMPMLNAFAADVAANGMLRRKTRVLGIGYPLLTVLSIEQAAGVIAHEIGHFAGSDSKTARFHYAVLAMAEGALANARAFGTFGFVQGILLLPMAAYLFIARRLGARVSKANEYAADALEAELFGARTAADTLIVVETFGEEFEEIVWKPMIEAWKNGTEFPASIIDSIDENARAPASREKMAENLEHALSKKTGRFDSHPCLADRLAALGVEPELPEFAVSVTGARGLLWDDEPALRKALDEHIRETLIEDFSERRAEVAATCELLNQVYETIDGSPNPRLSAEVVSLLMERSLHISESRARHEEIIARYGDIPSSVCEIAHAKIEAKNVAGAEDLLAVFERHPVMSGEAMKFLDWASCVGEEIPVSMLWLKAWLTKPETQARIKNAFNVFQQMNQEYQARSDSKQELEAHGLDSWHVDLIVSEIKKGFDVRRIWLARERSPSDMQVPMYRILIEVNSEDFSKAPETLGGICCLPGRLWWRVGNAFHIAEDPATRSVRDYNAGLVYEAVPYREAERAA